MKLSAALSTLLISLAAATPLPSEALSPRGLPGQPNAAGGAGAPNIGRPFPKGPMNLPNPYSARSPGNPGRWNNPPGAVQWSGGRPQANEGGQPRNPQPPHFGAGGGAGGDQPPHLRGGRSSTGEYRGPAKRRLYLHHPEPDILVSRRRVTRIIPPSPPTPPPPPPPPCYERPLPFIVEPEPVYEPAPPCPEPPALPEPEPEPELPIEVISVDVEPSLKKPSRSRSRSHSHHRRVRHDKEVYVERDRFIPVPVPVPVEPRYDTFRYVEGPRRSVPTPPPPPRRAPAIDEREHIHINVGDHRRTRDYHRR
ncbi:hypothetical protein CP533_0857 [Ophiocordyceps camponoti-saundersi (nom. inval.)]|nr:hypothetical protein CP533_0857 [Ophiocordyceps camponoti-saundersi (nom. inval.)]